MFIADRQIGQERRYFTGKQYRLSWPPTAQPTKVMPPGNSAAIESGGFMANWIAGQRVRPFLKDMPSTGCSSPTRTLLSQQDSGRAGIVCVNVIGSGKRLRCPRLPQGTCRWIWMSSRKTKIKALGDYLALTAKIPSDQRAGGSNPPRRAKHQKGAVVFYSPFINFYFLFSALKNPKNPAINKSLVIAHSAPTSK